jgi:hypothetical protein
LPGIPNNVTVLGQLTPTSSSEPGMFRSSLLDVKAGTMADPTGFYAASLDASVDALSDVLDLIHLEELAARLARQHTSVSAN